MNNLTSTLHFTPSPSFSSFKTHFHTFISPNRTNSAIRVSIEPPPPEFDYRSEILSKSRSVIAKTYPKLLDLADSGCLVLIQKEQYGPVPSWRTEFVEPEAIWLVGTNHISEKSAVDVEKVIRQVMPDNVVVELCRSRAGIMYTSNGGVELNNNQKINSTMFSLSGNGFFGAIGRSVNLGGQTALALRFLLALFSSKLSSQANRSFGDEFRVARKTSEEIGAQIVLGDRPIEITIERAWSSLIWKDKLSILKSLIIGITSPSTLSETTLKNECDESGRKLELYEQLSVSYPSLLKPLIHERDTYIAWSLKRSKAVNNSKKVVGVIGKGHMNGVVYSLISDQGNLRFRDLTSGKNGSTNWIQSLLNSLIRDTVITILFWLIYQNFKIGF